jgi:hypothetical protein
MMGMMGGMGGSMPSDEAAGADAMRGEAAHVVKEVVIDGLRVTADFPAFGPGDALEYRVTLRGSDGRAITADVGVSFTSTPEMEPMMESEMRDAAPMSTRWSPERQRDGSFVFRPMLARSGAYRLAVSVEHVGDRTLDPPVVLDQIVRLAAPPRSMGAAGGASHGTALRPLLLVGAGLMMVMMIFTVR